MTLAAMLALASAAQAQTADEPTNLRVTSTETNALGFEWNPPANANRRHYFFQSKRSSASGWGTIAYSDDPRNIIFGLQPGVSYDFRVQGCDSSVRHSANCGSWVSITARTALPSPSNVVPAATSATEIRLQWDASAGAGSYQAQIKRTNQPNWFTGRQPVSDTQITFGTSFTIDPDTSYDFRVRACTDAQATHCSGWTATVSARSQALDPGVTVSVADPFTVAEGDSATYSIRLDREPAGDVVISVLAAGNSDVTVDTDAQTGGNQNTLTFTMGNYSTPQTVTVSAAEDDDAADETATVTHSVVASQSSDEYDSVSIDAVNVAVTDDDTAAVRVSQVFLRVDEGQTVFYVVWLDTLPAGDVRISATSDNDAVTVTPAAFTLTRSNWSDGQTVTVRAPHDADAESESVTITHAVVAASSADEYDGVTIDELLVLVSDDESPTDYDVDNDGLIEIATREQLNAVRYDLDGNGVVDNLADQAAFARGFPRVMEDMCSVDFTETAVEGDPGPCTGYELLNDIALSGSWTPIGGNVGLDVFSGDSFGATFDGNGHTISGLRISLGSRKWVGLFGATSSGATIRRVGLVGVSVVGDSMVGALVGNNAGTVTESYVTGRVSAGSGRRRRSSGGWWATTPGRCR